VRHDAITLGHRLEVITDVARVDLGDGSTCDPHRIGTNLVEAGSASGRPGRHESIVPYRYW
jgi:hypothetical protein